MKNFKENILTFLRDEEGLTTVEYAVAGSLVGVALIAAFTSLGVEIRNGIIDLTNDVRGSRAG